MPGNDCQLKKHSSQHAHTYAGAVTARAAANCPATVNSQRRGYTHISAQPPQVQAYCVRDTLLIICKSSKQRAMLCSRCDSHASTSAAAPEVVVAGRHLSGVGTWRWGLPQLLRHLLICHRLQHVRIVPPNVAGLQFLNLWIAGVKVNVCCTTAPLYRSTNCCVGTHESFQLLELVKM
jgi:hypothetical protein